MSIQTRLAALPYTIGGYVIKDINDTYTIILNSKLSYERNIESYMHELNHIYNGDYEKDCSADSIEYQAHNY